jgi:hypothetical protein
MIESIAVALCAPYFEAIGSAFMVFHPALICPLIAPIASNSTTVRRLRHHMQLSRFDSSEASERSGGVNP